MTDLKHMRSHPHRNHRKVFHVHLTHLPPMCALTYFSHSQRAVCQTAEDIFLQCAWRIKIFVRNKGVRQDGTMKKSQKSKSTCQDLNLQYQFAWQIEITRTIHPAIFWKLFIVQSLLTPFFLINKENKLKYMYHKRTRETNFQWVKGLTLSRPGFFWAPAAKGAHCAPFWKPCSSCTNSLL